MLCQLCKVNHATVHFVKIVNGVKQEFNICESCAYNSQDLNIDENFKLDNNFSFENILSGLVDYINQSPNTSRATEMICKSCGTTYSEFKQKGVIGCSECYNTFSSSIVPLIKRVQGNLDHVGKIPVKSGKEILEKKKLSQLKEELQKAILSEEYEKAAELRDKIRELQKGE